MQKVKDKKTGSAWMIAVIMPIFIIAMLFLILEIAATNCVIKIRHLLRKIIRISGFWMILGTMPVFTIAMATLIPFKLCAAMAYRLMLKQLNRHYYYRGWLKRDLADCETILELGCGSKSPLLQLGYGKKTDAIDVWIPYIEKHNRELDYRKCWLCDVLEYNFPQKAYDAVVILDVLEHLSNDKINAIDLFGKIERCARKKVIIFSPNGYIPNDETDNNPYQAHVSAWQPKDFKKRGYKVFGGTGFKPFFGNGSLPKHPQIIFYLLGMLSQPLVYHFPKLAFHSYAVKEINWDRLGKPYSKLLPCFGTYIPGITEKCGMCKISNACFKKRYKKKVKG